MFISNRKNHKFLTLEENRIKQTDSTEPDSELLGKKEIQSTPTLNTAFPV